MLPLLALSAVRVAPTIVAPNTSLATTPIAYFVREAQRCAELLIEAAGQSAMPWQSDVLAPDYTGDTAAPAECVTTMAEYINSRATTIYGGTAEIQRGIIAKHVLGL